MSAQLSDYASAMNQVAESFMDNVASDDKLAFEKFVEGYFAVKKIYGEGI